MYTYLNNDLMRKNALATKVGFLAINLLGASPYNPNLKGAYKRLPVIYSLLLMGSFTIQILIIYYAVLNMELSIPVIMLLVQKVCGSVPPILIIAQALYCKNALKERVGDITFADQCLHSDSIDVDFDKLKQVVNKLFKYFTIYAVMFCGLMVILLFKTIKNEFGFFNAILMSIAFSSDILYSIYYTYYFCTVLIYLATRYQSLNNAMASLTDSSGNNNSIELIRVPHNDVRTNIVGTIKFVHGIYRIESNEHNKTCDLFITVQFLQALLITSISIYVLTCIHIGYDSFNDTDISIVVLFILSIGHCFLLNLCSTIISCEYSSIKANNMETLVHKLMVETDDTNLLGMLEDFSLQLLHEKVIFTACDFFEIDFSLFSKITGAVVSYVVIFMQFGKFDYNNIFHHLNNETDLSN